MKTRISMILAAMVPVLALGCRAVEPVPEMEPEAARFSHSEEVVMGDDFLVVADRRMFAAMAFLNAGGYDAELEGFAMHPVRVQVRREVEKRLKNEPRKLKTYQAYYREIIAGRISAAAYKDYVLSLSADYPFTQIQPVSRLHYPGTAETLRRLPDLLNELWTTVNLEEIWKQVKPSYVTEIHSYDITRMKQQRDFLWDYLRMERQAPFIIVRIPDLLDKHLGSMGAEYRPYFYRVDNPGANDGRLDMHEYLHTVVGPLVDASYPKFEAKLAEYYLGALNTPATATCRSPQAFVKECLATAVNRRISVKFENDPAWTELKETQIARDMKDGFSLIRPFYDLLVEYEQGTAPFDQFVPTLFERLPEHTP